MIRTFIVVENAQNITGFQDGGLLEQLSKQNGSPLFKNIDLAYLHELSGENKTFEKNILEQFIIQAPEELAALENAYNNEDWKLLKAKAHNLKTTISFLGLQSASCISTTTCCWGASC